MLTVLLIEEARGAEAPPDFLWARVFGGTNYDLGYDVATDKDGNVYFTGWATPPDMFRNEAPAGGQSAGTYFVAKTDPVGRLLWSDQSPAHVVSSLSQIVSTGTHVAVDGLGRVCATGYFFETVQLGERTLNARGAADVFVVVYGRDGKALWTQQIGGSADDRSGDITTDSAGHVYVAGGFSAPARIGETQLSSESGGGVFLAKFDPQGKLLWVQEGLGSPSRPSLAVDPQGNTWLASPFGVNVRKVTFGTTTLETSDPSGSFVAKFDPQGKLLWAQKNGGNISCVALDQSGNGCVAGSYRGQAVFGTFTLPASSFEDPFVAKYGANGDVQWVGHASGPGSDYATGIAVDLEGNAYVAGYFNRQLKLGSTTLNSGYDLFAAKYDRDGNLAWALPGGGAINWLLPGTKYATGLAIDGNRQIYLTGYCSEFPLFGQISVPGIGLFSYDIFVAKLAAHPAPPEPQITGPPLDQDVWAEASLHINAFATGIAPLHFQWHFNGAALEGQNNAWLTLSNVTTRMAGHYSVVVSNSLGSMTSSVAKLTVRAEAPKVTLQPVSQLVEAGRDASFTVEATGVPRPTYQWRRNGQALPGETNRTLNLLQVGPAQAGVYAVVVSNEVAAIASADASLTVQPPAVPPPLVQWGKSAGGSGVDYGRAVAVDNEASILVAGTFSGQATFGTRTLTSAGVDDIFVAKLDRTGAWLWAQRAGGSSDDYANAIAVDGGGNIYVTGAFSATATFDASSLISRGGRDIFLAKYNQNGQILWVRQAGSSVPGFELGRGLAVDRAGNVFVTGEFLGTATFENTTLTGAGLSDVFVAKYDPVGNLQWVKSGGGSGNDSGAGVAVDDLGHAFVAGFVTTASLKDFFVTKYDAAGNVLWTLRDGGAKEDYATSIATDAAGDIYVTGKFQGYGNSSSTNKSLFISKYDTNGKGIWGRQTDGENPRAAVDGAGHVFVAGSFSGQATFIDSTLRSAGRTDIFVTHFDRFGNLEWARQIGGPEYEGIDGLAVDPLGNAFLAGNFYLTSTFDGQSLSGLDVDMFAALLAPSRPALTLPRISTQPRSQTPRAGDTVQFAVFAASSPAPVYQWQFNGTDLPGATNAVLTLANVTPAQDGTYAVRVSNAHGSVTSATATLKVLVLAPSFTMQPVSQAWQSGSDVGFEVAVTGIPVPTLQWQFNGVDIPGAVNTRLLLYRINTNHAGAYTVVASNSVGITTSAVAALTVKLAYETVPAFRDPQSFAANLRDYSAYGPALALDKQGNLYLTGAFAESTDFGATTLTASLRGDASTDIFVLKQDKERKVLWARRAGGPRNDFARAIAVDATGHVYITGAFAGPSANFGGTILPGDVFADAFLAKYDREGNVLWVRRAAGNFSLQVGSAIAVDRGENVFVAGSFEQSIQIGDFSFSDPGTEAFVAKFDKAGTAIWALQTKGSGTTKANGVAVDESGNAYVTGSFSGLVDFGGSTLNSATLPFGGNAENAFLAKYDPAGKLLWARGAGGSTGRHSARAVAIDASANAWVVGGFYGSTDFGGETLASLGGGDIFVAKYDRTGQPLWVRRGGGGNDDTGFSLALDDQGDGYVAGHFSGTAHFGDTGFLRGRTNSAFLAKIHSDGNFVWAKQTDTTYSTFFSLDFWGILPQVGVAVDAERNAYFAGLFEGRSSFDESAVNAVKATDIFVAKVPAEPPPPPPIITGQPLSQTVLDGASATFSVAASAATSLKYQWRFNGVNLPGAASATLALPLVRESDAGSYQVAVRNPGGEVLSQPAQLTVTLPAWVSTLAGSGTAGFKDGMAAEANFSSPSSVAVGPDGSVFVVDTANHQIRRISPTGGVNTFAGTGAAGLADGPVSSAQFNSPAGLFVSATGDLFVADAGNHRIRKISAGASPIVSTVAGSGTSGFQNGAALSAQFNTPSSLVADATGNLYVSDSGNHAIRTISLTGNVATLAGNGVAGFADGVGASAQFNQPTGLALAGDGSLFVADTANHRIRKIARDGSVTTVAGEGAAGLVNGPAATARFNLPQGLAIDAGGNLLVTEIGNHTIRRMTSAGLVTTLAGTGTAGFTEGSGASAQFNKPGGLGIDARANLVVVDTGNQRVRLITTARPRLTVERSGNEVVFSWPVFGGEFILESTDEITASTAWKRVANPAGVVGQTNTVRLGIDAQQKFYRLRRP